MAVQLAEELGKLLGIPKNSQGAGTLQLILQVKTFQASDELPAKHAAQNLFRQKEPVARIDPALVVRCDASLWNHTVDVRMRQ